VVDMDTRWWCEGTENGLVCTDRFRTIVSALKFYMSFLGNSLSVGEALLASVIACFSDRAEVVSVGEWAACKAGFENGLTGAIQKRLGVAPVLETPIAQGISKSLLFLKKKECTESKVIVFECSRESIDFSSQSVPLSNCGWAASMAEKCRLHVVSLASATPSSNLLSICAKTGGIHIPYSMCGVPGKLVQSLMFHLTGSDDVVSKSLKVRPQSQRAHMGTVCVCHNRSIDKGYVCSICLSIYCNETSGICSVCGSRIRREAKDDLPINQQIFSRLFS
jgi:hypothetical protein